MATKDTAEKTEWAEITDRIYIAYASETGILFGIPADLRGSVETVIQTAVEMVAAPTLQARIDRLGAENEKLKMRKYTQTEVDELNQLVDRLIAEKAELVEALKDIASVDRIMIDGLGYEGVITKITERAQAVLAKHEGRD